jgi:hypothetical protein
MMEVRVGGWVGTIRHGDTKSWIFIMADDGQEWSVSVPYPVHMNERHLAGVVMLAKLTYQQGRSDQRKDDAPYISEGGHGVNPVPKSSHGYGLPGYLPDEYLNVEETLALGELDLYVYETRCSCCGEPPDWRGLQKAHIVRRGLGGKKGSTGPTLRLRAACHEYLDTHADETPAIRRDGAVCWLRLADGSVQCEVLMPPGSVRL